MTSPDCSGTLRERSNAFTGQLIVLVDRVSGYAPSGISGSTMRASIARDSCQPR